MSTETVKAHKADVTDPIDENHTAEPEAEQPPATPRGRCSGILLHITSLPTEYGIGDVGPSAINFLDWLQKAGQSLWQFLPLNPHGHAGSPYGTPSALAANPAIIALDVSCSRMVDDDLIEDFKSNILKSPSSRLVCSNPPRLKSLKPSRSIRSITTA